jgi:hypothetical protein
MKSVSVFVSIVLVVFPSYSSGWTWSDILKISFESNHTTNNDSSGFEFHDSLWDSSVDDVSLETIQDVIGCPYADEYGTLVDAFGYSRIPTEGNTWSAMYKAYHAVVPEHEATIPRNHQHNAFVMPVEVDYSPYVGRGVKAATFIPKGTMVWRPRNAAEFTSAKQLRLFLEHIMTHSTKEVACDAIRWLYVSRASPAENDFVLCIDFDEGSIINRAMTDEEWNVAQLHHTIDDPENRVYGCQEGSLYATKDIFPGDGKCMSVAAAAAAAGIFMSCFLTSLSLSLSHNCTHTHTHTHTHTLSYILCIYVEIRMDYGDFAEGYGFTSFGLDATGL